MGVRGLSTFVENHPHLLKSHRLSDTAVIIDGNNLKHFLHSQYRVDCAYGGDYYEYAAAVRKFFKPLLQCHIEPIVIFDGGHDRSDRKFQTTLERAKKRLNQVTSLSETGKCSGNVQPINSQQVFVQVLSEMGVRHAQCDFEADDQIPYLANHYDCPVMTEDSDFCIFDIRRGVIRLSYIDPVVAVSKTKKGVIQKFVKCYIYHIDYFSSCFGIDRRLLPLFATLIGNDFADQRSFQDFYSGIGLSRLDGDDENPEDYKRRKFNRVLKWLGNSSPEEAVDRVLLHFQKETKKSHMKLVIQQSVESYNIKKCNLDSLVDGNVATFQESLRDGGTLTTLCGQPLPIPFMVSFHKGDLPSEFPNIFYLLRTMLPLQADDTSLKSSFACSRYIRKIVYGFLLQHNAATDAVIHQNSCRRRVEEYDRHGESLVVRNVEPIFTFRNGNPLPDLCDVYKMDKTSLQNIVSKVLDVEVSQITSVPGTMQLLFACIRYWLKNCLSKPPEEFVYALVINLIYFSYIVKSLGKNRPSILIGMETIKLDSDVASSASNLKRYQRKPSKFNKKHFQRIVHCYSELQTCILYSMHLNMLLTKPFEHPKMHDSFSGTFLYNLTKDLLCSRNPDLLVSDLLGKKSALHKTFTLLKTKILDNVPPECFERISDRFLLPESKKAIKSNIVKTKYAENATAVFNKFELLKIADKTLHLKKSSADIYI